MFAGGMAVYGNIGQGATVQGGTVVMFEAPGGSNTDVDEGDTSGMKFSEEGTILHVRQQQTPYLLLQL